MRRLSSSPNRIESCPDRALAAYHVSLFEAGFGPNQREGARAIFDEFAQNRLKLFNVMVCDNNVVPEADVPFLQQTRFLFQLPPVNRDAIS